MAVVAVIMTIISGIAASFLEPVPFAVSIPVAVMGGFVIRAIERKKDGKD